MTNQVKRSLTELRSFIDEYEEQLSREIKYKLNINDEPDNEEIKKFKNQLNSTKSNNIENYKSLNEVIQ